MYPSAEACRECHEQIYDEWASSSHAYAAVSPMFHKFEQTITTLSKGTIGYFCMRCHTPVGTSMGYPREASIWDAIPAAREGVTCIVCHRVRTNYGKADGERRVETGSLYDPVFGAGYGEELAKILENKDHYKVKTSPADKGPGQDIHTGVIHFEQIRTSHFCTSCHQVAVEPGIKLEVVWEQYRASPAHKMGISCQDCHMGKEPGLAAGYEKAPVAVVGGKKIDPDRKHSNHLFFGPGYSIAHPGLFPLNPKNKEWSHDEWLRFDYRAGWGTEEFEDRVDEKQVDVCFPEEWKNSDDRMDAREILDANLKKLEEKREIRRRLMENSSCVEGPVFRSPPTAGRPLDFYYVVTNKNTGHNMPSGSLGAQPQVWLNVVLTGPRGQHLWESGYVDSLGDMADLHSLDVAAGRIRPDQQLFNLQTKFLIQHVTGPDREMYLPINVDIDQLPFIRPSAFPIKVMNHPPGIRMEGHSLPPLGSRQAKYNVPANLMQTPGVYHLSVRMRSRAEPIYFMRFCRATPEMERNMNEWMLDFHEQTTPIMVR
ncbi:MAG: cytochrome C [Verrucomicrobiae bacterium]|nr:cytochrome C [Verrucomicrobiae bacterium]